MAQGYHQTIAPKSENTSNINKMTKKTLKFSIFTPFVTALQEKA